MVSDAITAGSTVGSKPSHTSKSRTQRPVPTCRRDHPGRRVLRRGDRRVV